MARKVYTPPSQEVAEIRFTPETWAFIEPYLSANVNKSGETCDDICVLDLGDVIEMLAATPTLTSEIITAFEGMDLAQRAAIAATLIDPDATNTLLAGPNGLLFEND